MASQRRGFAGNSFHQIAIRNDPIYIGADDLMPWLIERCGKVCFGYRHANPLPKSLAQGAGCRLYTGRQSVFRVSRRFAVKLAKMLDLVEREIISRQMEQGIQKHGTMPTRKDE